MEDLQGILEKINREGVEKAEAEAARIVGEAKAKAEAILKSAREEAAKATAEAERAAKESAARAEETMRLAARDTLLGVERSVSALLDRLLAKDVDRALSDDGLTLALVSEAIRDLTGPGEIACGAKLAAALKAQLPGACPFTVVTDEARGTGFSVRLDGGRVEHDFSGATIANELSRRLQPELAKLLKAEG